VPIEREKVRFKKSVSEKKKPNSFWLCFLDYILRRIAEKVRNKGIVQKVMTF